MKFKTVSLFLLSLLALAIASPLKATTSSLTDSPIPNIQEHSLLNYASSQYAQRGEDGILQEILLRLEIRRGFFVEFGASDGITDSNSRHLVEQGWSGLFIEADLCLYQSLAASYKDTPNILCLHQFVKFSGLNPQGKTIDEILDEHFPDQEIDFMSIDIDGGDHLVLEELKRRPKILCVEGGFSWHPKFTRRVPDYVALQNLQQPLAVMIAIGKKLGYEPICFTQNTFFIRNDLYAPFKEIINDPLTLWRDAWNMLPSETKQWLLKFRADHPMIPQVEGPKYRDLNL